MSKGIKFVGNFVNSVKWWRINTTTTTRISAAWISREIILLFKRKRKLG
jgi:hypothetical protein